MNAREKVDGAAVVAGRDMAKVLEFFDEAFDAVAQPIRQRVMWNDHLAGWLGRDDGFGSRCTDQLPKQVAVIGFVADDGTASHVGDQLRSHDDVVNLSASQEKAQWAALGIGQDMDFGGQSSSGTPQSLIAVPPFPVAAC